jgi:hypothetical protein
MTASRDQQGTTDPAREGDLGRCAQPAPALQRLESYWKVRIPATYWLEMVFGEGGWRPAAHIPMPYHHATRLDLTNVTDFPALVAHQSKRLRFTIEVTSREIQKVPDRRLWLTTYRARIVEVCIPDQ